MTLLRLAVTCPHCQRVPNRRIFPVAVERWKDVEPDTPADTHKCTWCGEIFIVTARAYHEAEAA